MIPSSPGQPKGGETASLQVAPATSLDHVAPLAFTYVSPEAYLSSEPPVCGHILAAVIHGEMAAAPRPWPQVSSGLRPLETTAAVELLHSRFPPRYAVEDGFDLAITEEILCGAWRPDTLPDVPLEGLTEALYERLFPLIERLGFPHLQRIWNVVPAINAEEGGMERYKQFCMGRHAAFSKYLPDIDGRYPSASAVGSAEGPLCVYFLAARTPGTPIENPNQVSAYNYPRQYGPRSPSFSRALVRRWQDQACLFLSGTASIKGHESKHNGALAAQADETLDNLKTLVAVGSDASGIGFDLAPATSVLKAYVRRPTDLLAIRDLLHRHFGRSMKLLYLQADICRVELLLELDGVVFSAPPAT